MLGWKYSSLTNHGMEMLSGSWFTHNAEWHMLKHMPFFV